MAASTLVESPTPRPTLADAFYQIYYGMFRCLGHRMDRYTYAFGYALSLVFTLIALMGAPKTYGTTLTFSNKLSLCMFAAAFIVLGSCLCRRCNDSGIPLLAPMLPYAIGLLFYMWYFLYDTNRFSPTEQFSTIGYALILICSVPLPAVWLFLPPKVNNYNKNMLYLIATDPAPKHYYDIMSHDASTEFVRHALKMSSPQ